MTVRVNWRKLLAAYLELLVPAIVPALLFPALLYSVTGFVDWEFQAWKIAALGLFVAFLLLILVIGELVLLFWELSRARAPSDSPSRQLADSHD